MVSCDLQVAYDMADANSGNNAAAVTDQELQAMPGMARLEHYLDVILKGELKAAMARRDEAYDRASQCHRLRRFLKDLVQIHELEYAVANPQAAAAAAAQPKKAAYETNNECDRMLEHPLTTSLRIDLGCHCYAAAEVPDARVVHINIGCGVVVPMTHEEAHRFLLKREQLCKNEVTRLNKEILRTKYRIRIVMESLRRLHEGYVQAQTAKARR
jgi:hypothetical protein